MDEYNGNMDMATESHKPVETRKNQTSRANLNETEEMNIVQLNDDCLLLIFDQVELMDLIAIKETCYRFQLVVTKLLKRYKYFNFGELPCGEKGLTMTVARKILSVLGPSLRYLSLSEEKFTTVGVGVLKVIPCYCLYLTDLEIQSFNMNAKTLKSLQAVLESLKSLKLIDCNIGDYIEQNLARAKHLSCLNLSYNKNLTGKCLRVVKNLRSLNLEGCQEVREQPFCVFVNNNRSLAHLNIRNCTRLATNAIQALVQNTIELTSIVCTNHFIPSNPCYMAQIAKMTHLKEVSVQIYAESIDTLLRELANRNSIEHLELIDDVFVEINYGCLRQMSNLKELILNYKIDLSDAQLATLGCKANFTQLHVAGCPNITDAQLIDFIGKNPLLEKLDISYCQITKRLLFAVIEILDKRIYASSGSTFARIRRPLNMIVGHTGIERKILDDVRVSSKQHLLKLSFDSTVCWH